MVLYLRLAVLVLFALAPTARSADTASDSRLALVVGNSAYPGVPLKNPVNDARAMARSLQDLGFEVLLRENVSQQQFILALREFGDRLKEKRGVGLFYYAGHGVQLKGLNYLIPIDAVVESEDEVRYRAIDANQVLEKMAEASNPLNLVILDACRDNPFPRSFRSRQTGLAQMDAPTGTLIAFATAPGAVAYDGEGVNGVYTKYLLRHLTIPGLPIELVLKRVREGVSRETKQKQIPWESSSLLGEFYFKPAPAGSPAVTQADSTAVELAFWESVKNSNAPSEYRAYLEKYPAGQFAVLARSRMDSLLAQAPAPGRKSAVESTPDQLALAQPIGPAARSNEIVRVGDSWTYQQLLKGGWFTQQVDTVTVTVIDVQGDKIREQLTVDRIRDYGGERVFKAGFDPTGGFQELELPGRYFLAEFSPYISNAGVPAAGKEWKDIGATLSFGGQAQYRSKTRMVVRSVKEERVKVPAGEFVTVRVEAEGSFHSQNGWKTVRLTYWYSPEFRRTIKMARKLLSEFVQDGSNIEESLVLVKAGQPGGGR